MKKSLSSILSSSRGEELLQALAGFSENPLPPKGLIAGGAVASIILSECWGGSYPVNDIDLYQVDNSSLLKQSMPFRVTDISLELSDYRQCFYVAESGYRVVHSERNGIINSVLVKMQDALEEHMQCCIMIIKGFDLNCCQVGIDLESKCLLWTEEFAKFIDTGQIQVTHLATPYHTAIRLPKKRQDLSCYCDIKTEVQLLATYVDLVSMFRFQNRRNHRYARHFGGKYKKMFETHESELSTYCRINLLPEQPLLPFPGIPCQDFYRIRFEVQSLADDMKCYFKQPLTRLNSKTLVEIYNNLYRPTTPSSRKRQFATALDTGEISRINALISKPFLKCDHHVQHLQRLERFAADHPRLAWMFQAAGLNIAEQNKAIGTLKKLSKEHGIFVCGLITGALRSGTLRCSDISYEAVENLVAEYKSEFTGARLVEPLDLSWFSGRSHVTELFTLDQLLQEGLRMHHCVGGYAKFVKSGSSRIFHLEYLESSSTLEIFKGVIGEHRGRSNSQPGSDHTGLAAALNRYLQRVIAKGATGPEGGIHGADLLRFQYPPECYR